VAVTRSMDTAAVPESVCVGRDGAVPTVTNACLLLDAVRFYWWLCKTNFLWGFVTLRQDLGVSTLVFLLIIIGERDTFRSVQIWDLRHV